MSCSLFAATAADIDGALNEEVEAIAQQAVDLILPAKPLTELPAAPSSADGGEAGEPVTVPQTQSGEGSRNGASGSGSGPEQRPGG